MTQSLEKILDFSQKENQELKLENEVEETIKTNFKVLKEYSKIDRPKGLKTIEELKNNYDSLKDILTPETQ